MQLFLLHMRRFDLHPILQHVDVVGLSVHYRKPERIMPMSFSGLLTAMYMIDPLTVSRA